MTSAGEKLHVVPPLHPSVFPKRKNVLPVIDALVTVSGPCDVVVVFEIVRICCDDVPLLTMPKAMVSGTEMTASVPSPVRSTVFDGAFIELFAIVIVAGR